MKVSFLSARQKKHGIFKFVKNAKLESLRSIKRLPWKDSGYSQEILYFVLSEIHLKGIYRVYFRIQYEFCTHHELITFLIL